jgi:hypothetical protein
MNKTAAGISIAIALAVASFFVLFGKQNEAQAPIVDPTCEPGYTLIGEGCISLKDACELQGNQYYFDEASEQCLTR